MKKSGVSIYFILVVVLASLIIACGPTSRYMPKAGGKEGELLLVIDPKYWQDAVGDTLREFLQQDYKALPQSEPLFKLYRIFPQNFVRGFKTTNNILMININPSRIGQEPTLEVGYDSWARDQIVLRLNCATDVEFFAAFKEKRNRIYELIHNKDMERIQKKFKVTESAYVTDELKKNMQIYMTVPEGFYPNELDSGFVYFTHEAEKSVDGNYHQITRGLWAYSFPYTDPNTFTIKFAQHLRDSITRIHMPGAVDSSYMRIEDLYPVDSSSITLNGEFALEMRGLWKMENYFMGGPFINYMTYDRPRNRIVMIDGFVFAPRFEKKEYILQMEGILRSIKYLP